MFVPTLYHDNIFDDFDNFFGLMDMPQRRDPLFGKRADRLMRTDVRETETGYELDILTKNLYGESGEVRCNDCTDYVLPLEAGDEVSVVETTSRGYFVKHNGVSGWYGGELL